MSPKTSDGDARCSAPIMPLLPAGERMKWNRSRRSLWLDTDEIRQDHSRVIRSNSLKVRHE